LTEVVATLSVERCRRRRLCRREYGQLGPPPSLRSATAVLTATRGKGVDQMPPQGADFLRNALQNEGRGVCRLAKDRQSRTCRVANWAPQTARLLAGNTTSTATATQARPGRWSLGGLVFRAIGFSSNHDRLAVMHQPIESDGGLGAPITEPQVCTAVVDVPIAQFRTEAKRPRKRRTKYDRGN